MVLLMQHKAYCVKPLVEVGAFYKSGSNLRIMEKNAESNVTILPTSLKTEQEQQTQQHPHNPHLPLS